MRPFPRFWAIVVCCLVLASSDARAACGPTTACNEPQSPSAEAPDPVLRIPRVAQRPEIDRFVRLAAGQGEPEACPEEVCGVRVSDFRQREPGDGVPVSRATYAYLSYDDGHLYVAFICREDPALLRARMARREDIFSDDRVGVFLDTFYDRQRAYAFVANPLGIQLDGITTEGQGNDYSFDTLWHSEGRSTPEGFVVWMAIPFKSLRFRAEPEQVWGISLGRLIPRNSEAAYWPFVTRRKESFVAQFARLEGLERISPGRNLQFIPYGLFARARFLDPALPDGPAFRTDTEARAGLDAKFVLRDAFTLDIAVNPDFSQVESDEPQVTINQRFEVFFPEKRPFFIENAGFFQTRQNLFFTRRVVDPQFGVRLTGKVDRWAVGLLAMDDRAPGRLAPVSGPSASGGDRAAIGVGRVLREFGRQSSAGMLMATRHLGDARSTVYSADTRLAFNPNWFFNGQITLSDDREAGGARILGSAALAEIQHIGRHLRYFSRYTDRSPEFRARLGFVPRVDLRVMEHFAEYAWRPEGRSVQSHGPIIYSLVNWDRRNRVQDWFVQTGYGAGFGWQTLLEFLHTETFELFQEIEFRRRNSTVYFENERLRWLGIRASVSFGTGVNFFPAAGLPPFLADATGGLLQLTFRPVPRLRIDQSYIYSRLAVRADSLPAGAAAGTAIFNHHLTRSRLNYQFTRELSLRVIVDYSAVLPNQDLVALGRTKRLAGDVLLTYLINPGTALHLGYTDIYDNLALEPGTPPQLRRIGSPTTSTGRQFFAKLSYLLRY
jgi:hypothetical protein